MLRNSIDVDGLCSQGSRMEILDTGLRRTRPKDGLHHLALLGRHFSPCTGRLGEVG